MYINEWGRPAPTAVEELDHELAEFINHLWQDDMPEGAAADALSGFSRLLPHARNKLPISKAYFRNWRETVVTVVRTRALPLSGLMIKGMAGIAYLARRPEIAAILLVGFRGLLRSGEIVNLPFFFFVASERQQGSICHKRENGSET